MEVLVKLLYVLLFKENLSEQCPENSTQYGINAPQDHEHLQVHHLSSFYCYLSNMSHLVPGLTNRLKITAEYTQDVLETWSKLISIQPAPANCTVQEELDEHEKVLYVKCLLKLFENWLAKF